MCASRTETTRRSPATTARSGGRLGPVTTTRPSIMVSSKVSAWGSQAASKVVPVTRTSNGPARTAHSAGAPAGCATAACTEPRSRSTSAPTGEVAVTRAVAPGASSIALPSEKRASSGAPPPAAIHAPTTPSPPPTENESGTRPPARVSDATGATELARRHPAPASATQAAAASAGIHRPPRARGAPETNARRARSEAPSPSPVERSATSATAAPRCRRRELRSSIARPPPARAGARRRAAPRGRSAAPPARGAASASPGRPRGRRRCAEAPCRRCSGARR